jgi:LCP family protein required for cell wall assembly
VVEPNGEPETGPAAGSDAEPAAASGAEPETEPEPAPAAEADEAVALGPSRRRRAGLIAGRTAVALVSAATLAVVGIGWFTVDRFQASTNKTSALAEVNSEPNQPPVDDGATDILLVGDDSRTDEQGNPLPESVLKLLRTQYDAGVNTDTIMVLRLPHNGGPAYAVSIPRDTYVSIPGYQDDKINAAYGVIKARTGSTEAGQKALIETVQNLTGVHIDHYVEVNLYGFYLLSKAIGGVDVCLRHATSDSDSGANFPAGKQTVSGGAALSFVRQRKNLPNGDLDRIVRQQVFLASAARKVLSAGTLTNPTALSGLLDAMKKSLVTDPGLDFTTLLQQGQSLISGNMTFVTIPVVNSNARSPRGQSIVQVDVAQVHQFMASLAGGQPAPTSGKAPVPATTTPPPASAGASTTTTSQTTTSQPTPVATPTNEPTPPVSIDGVRCVD